MGLLIIKSICANNSNFSHKLNILYINATNITVLLFQTNNTEVGAVVTVARRRLDYQEPDLIKRK